MWNGYGDQPESVAVIPDLMRYNYDLVCLMDSGRYCNIVAGAAAAMLDPEGTRRCKCCSQMKNSNSSSGVAGERQFAVCSTKCCRSL